MKHPSEMNADEKAMWSQIVHLKSVLEKIYDDLAHARGITDDNDDAYGHALIVLLCDAEELAKEALGK